MLSKKLMGLLSLLFILIITIGAVSAENETTALDESPTQNNDLKNFTQMQSQIDKASFDSVIKVNGTYKSDGQPINITKSLTIEGDPDATFDGNHQSRVFNMMYGNLTLRNLNFINGLGIGQGGAILSACNLILENCTFKDNTLTPVYIEAYGEDPAYTMSAGGAISCEGNIIAKNCDFINSTANTCAVIYSYEGYSLTCTDCNFIGNTEKVASGILCVDMSTKATLTRCNFINNTANYGIITSYNGGKLTCSDCTFTNNNNAAFLINDGSNNVKINGKKYKGNVVLTDSLKTTYLIKGTAKNVKTTYNSGAKSTIKITEIKSKKAVEDYSMIIKIKKSGKTYKINDEAWTNSKGKYSFDASKLNAGTYSVEITSYSDLNNMDIKKVTYKIKVTKAKATVKAPKVTNNYKKSQYFKVTVKANKKAVKNTYVKIKIDKKTYKVKTNSKGVAKFNTKSLKVGKHKVVISSGNSNYKMSGKSTITIK